MAKNSLKILAQAHAEDAKMSTMERDLKERRIGGHLRQKQQHLGRHLRQHFGEATQKQLLCNLKMTTKLFWGNENCHLVSLP